MQATATKTPHVCIVSTPELNGEYGAIGINGELYHVFDRYDRYEFQSMEKDSKSTVYHKAGKPKCCTCKGWKYGGGKDCKHVIAARELLNQW